jgi:hypothetical protein
MNHKVKMMSEDMPGAENKPIILNSNRLQVEIAYPGSVYNWTRFDWTGFVTQVTLDGAHTFCVPESYIPGNGSTKGVGLCNEFGIEIAVGYADAKVGEAFPKIGVGLLKKYDESVYSFANPYEIVQLYPIHVNAGSDQVQFNVDPVDCRGYAARLIKTFKVHDNVLEIHYQLENTGTKPIVTHEYCHNFVGIDKQNISPEYHLHFPYPIELEKVTQGLRTLLPKRLMNLLPGFILDWLAVRAAKKRMSIMKIKGGEVDFTGEPKNAFYMRIFGYHKTEKAQWELTHRTSGVAMREIDDFAPSRAAVWGFTHVVSSEIFTSINLAPGETQNWVRRFEFDKVGA